MTKSASLPASSTDWVVLIRASTPGTASSVSSPLSTKVARFALATDIAFSRVSALREYIVTSYPAVANTCARPGPHGAGPKDRDLLDVFDLSRDAPCVVRSTGRQMSSRWYHYTTMYMRHFARSPRFHRSPRAETPRIDERLSGRTGGFTLCVKPPVGYPRYGRSLVPRIPPY